MALLQLPTTIRFNYMYIHIVNEFTPCHHRYMYDYRTHAFSPKLVTIRFAPRPMPIIQ